MKELTLIRKWFTPQSTIGELSIDGKFECFILEPPTLDPPTKPRAVPEGRYKVVIAFSPKHQRDVPLLVDVPDFEGVEMHIGNFPRDTEACLLPGTLFRDDQVVNSTIAFNHLFPQIDDETWITISRFPEKLEAQDVQQG